MNERVINLIFSQCEIHAHRMLWANDMLSTLCAT